MLIKDLYTVDFLNDDGGGKHSASISINPGHEVFKGHFPENPVMPGVCMMQVVKELAEQITSRTLMLHKLTNAKFMALINPETNPVVKLELEVRDGADGSIVVKNISYIDTVVALKLTAEFRNA